MTPAERDALALRLIDEGRLQTDPATGAVLADGRLYLNLSAPNYLRVRIAGTNIGAHRIVYLAAYRAIPPGYVINHRDGSRSNNRLANLEAVSHRQNVLHARRSPLYAGTYPDEDRLIEDEIWRAIDILHARGGATRAELMAIVGKAPEPIEDEDIETLMRATPLRRPRRKVG